MTNTETIQGNSTLLRNGLWISLILAILWAYGFLAVGTDIHQGNIYRVLYIHVPSAFAAFLCAACLCFCSIMTLRTMRPHFFHGAKASAEVGLLFTAITIVTGAIWGKPTWGTWWSWDARLTTTFILALLYSSYLVLCNSMEASNLRPKVCSVLGILIAVDVPIIYKSVTWWRTLHQPPSLVASGGSNMSAEIATTLIANVLFLLFIGSWLIYHRTINLKLEEQLHYEILA